MKRLPVVFGLPLAAAICGAACTTLLGNDFTIIGPGAGGGSSQGGEGPGGATSTGGGGVGGSAGPGGAGGGGMMLPTGPISCTWVLPEHVEVARITAPASGSFGDIYGVRLDGTRARFFMEHFDGAAMIDVHTVSATSNVVSQSSGGSLVQALRVNLGRTGVVFSESSGGAEHFRLLEVNDSDANASGASVRPLHVPMNTAVTDYAPNGNISGAFTRVPALGEGGAVDFVIAYQTTSGVYKETYGRWEDSPATPVVITPAGAMLDSGDANPRALIHHEGNTYAFIGSGSTTSMRQYTLNPTSQSAPRDVPPVGHTVFGHGSDAQSSRFFVFGIPSNVELYAGRIDNTALETVVFDTDLPMFGSFASGLEVPLFNFSRSWLDDWLVMFGNDPVDRTQLRLWIVDGTGTVRMLEDMAFNATLGANETRVATDDFEVVPVASDFGPFGGSIHVMWTEEHAISGNESRVAYYDQLNCVPDDA